MGVASARRLRGGEHLTNTRRVVDGVGDAARALPGGTEEDHQLCNERVSHSSLSISPFEPSEAIALLSTSCGDRWKSSGPLLIRQDQYDAHMTNRHPSSNRLMGCSPLFETAFACGVGAVRVVMRMLLCC